MSTEVLVKAPAKLNLHLGIHPGRDARGYHRADSLMVAVSLFDEVRIRERASGSGLFLSLSEDVGVPAEQNSAWVAAQRLCEAYDRPDDYAIDVRKAIPAQSGLGGSSSDAASVILGLCQLWGVDACDRRVVDVARSVGADVPFFLRPRPSLLTGAGDVLERTLPELRRLPIVLVRPRDGVSTPAAYRAFDDEPTEPRSLEALCRAVEQGDAVAIAAVLYNNLALAAVRLVPACADVVSWLKAQPGVLGAQVTGSGSCAFGICACADVAAEVAARVHGMREGWWAFACETVGLGAQFC